jgi:pilus assembly protein CpaE
MKISVLSDNEWPASADLFAQWSSDITIHHGLLGDAISEITQAQPDILWVSINAVDERFFGDIARLYNDLPNVKVLARYLSPETDFLLKVIRAGILDVITEDSPAQIDAVMTRHILPLKKRLSGGKQIAFMSGKGGDGSTFFLINVAAALAKLTDKRILIVDYSLPFGDSEIYLSADGPKHNVSDFVQEIERLDDVLFDAMVHHVKPGVDLLASANSVESMINAPFEKLVQLLDVSRRYYDIVLIDLGSTIGPLSAFVLDEIDQLVVVASPEICNARRASQVLNFWISAGLPAENIKLIVNRCSRQLSLTIVEFEKAVGRKVDLALPETPGAGRDSVVHNQPFVDLNPSSKFSKLIIHWAGQLMGFQEEKKTLWQRLKKN